MFSSFSFLKNAKNGELDRKRKVGGGGGRGKNFKAKGRAQCSHWYFLVGP